MNLLMIALMVGLGLGLLNGVMQAFRLQNSLNAGMRLEMVVGSVILFFIFGFVTTLIIGSVISWIF